MHIFRPTFALAAYFSAVLAVNPLIIYKTSNDVSQRSNLEQGPEHLSYIETRQEAQIAKQVLKIWIKIGKSAVKAFSDEVSKQNKAGAGFFRDFSDLIDQFPDPPAGIDENKPPTKRAQMEKRSENEMTMCKDSFSSASGNCFLIGINEGALTAGFVIDSKALSAKLGGGVSAIRIETPGLICGVGTKVKTHLQGSFFNTVGVQHCEGTRAIIGNEFVNLSGDLNDNVHCICCFKSPGA